MYKNPEDNGKRILVMDTEFIKVDEEAAKIYEAHNVTPMVGLPLETEDDAIRSLKNADAMQVGLLKVTRNIIKNCPKLKVIGRFGVGVDNIDLEAATEQGIIVFNVPGIFTEPVAEHTILLMLALAKKLLKADELARAGESKWVQTYRTLMGTQLEGKTLGVVGLGSIGSAVAEKCHNAFNMKILAYDPYISRERAAEVSAELVDLETLLKESDVVTLHCPLTEETRQMIGRHELGLMKKTAFLINTARGAVVDEESLIEALRGRKIAGYATDVYTVEPPSADFPLFRLDNVVTTPHMAAHTREAYKKLWVVIAENMCRILEGGWPQPPANLVNKDVINRLKR
jgi:D-3-phosphoglycerate dehydrogenase